jgi:hypothetical protein
VTRRTRATRHFCSSAARGTASLDAVVLAGRSRQWNASEAARELRHAAELAELVAASRAMQRRQRRRR